jgi:cytidylate kinase
MGVITISSELGTGGVEIAGRVAAELGYALVDEQTSDRILRQYGLTKFKELYDSGPSLLDLVRVENLLIISMYNEILEALAGRGRVVILSRVGFAVLGGYADALNVHVVAPMAQRVQRIMASRGLAIARRRNAFGAQCRKLGPGRFQIRQERRISVQPRHGARAHEPDPNHVAEPMVVAHDAALAERPAAGENLFGPIRC